MFALYCANSKQTACEFVSAISIAGILGNHIATQSEAGNIERDGSMSWKLNGHDLCCAVLRKQGIDGDRGYKIVVDATYTRADALLLEIEQIWGVSYEGWTPVLLRMSVIFEGDRPNGKSTAVPRFLLNCGLRTGFVHEFLYLQCGYHGGKRNWGRMGYTNAALLYPDALTRLLAEIGFRRTGKE
jgi:hypothetical protein